MAVAPLNSKEVFVLNIRIKFQKYGVMKFIGHLDMMRYFQKAIRRAGIDIAYSEGYSPHQIMSFAAPLGVGVTSDGEYFDIEVKSSKSSQDAIEALNQTMVEGIRVLEYKRLPDTAKTAMSLVSAASYLIYVKSGYEALTASIEGLQAKVEAFYQEQDEINIVKQTKKQEINMNLKPLIYEMKALNLKDLQHLHEVQVENPEILASCCNQFLEQEETIHSLSVPALYLKVCTGSADNVKPELVLEAFCQFHGLPYEPFGLQIHRLEVYAKADEIPVKGEKERQQYQQFLDHWKKKCLQQGRPFPVFLTLGELGEEMEG